RTVDCSTRTFGRDRPGRRADCRPVPPHPLEACQPCLRVTPVLNWCPEGALVLPLPTRAARLRRDTSGVGHGKDETADALRRALRALVDDGESPFAGSAVGVDREPRASSGRCECERIEKNVAKQGRQLRLVRA